MRKIIYFLASPLIFLSFFAGSVLAKGNFPEIPEVSGIYNDPSSPGLKVRVFVHKEKPVEKPGKPAPTAPELICSISDPNSTADVAWAGWKLSSTWTYNLNPLSVPASVGGTNLPKIAGDGLSEWSSASGVNFVRGSDTSVSRQAYDEINVIAWGRTSGDALGVTYIRYYPDTGEVVDVDTIMNKKFSWAWSDSNSCAYQSVYDAENILTHELGHWVGLDDHYTSDYVNNTMYGYGSKGEVKKDTLTTGDINGVSSIYN